MDVCWPGWENATGLLDRLHTSARPRTPIPATLLRTRRSGTGWDEVSLNLTRLRPYPYRPAIAGRVRVRRRFAAFAADRKHYPSTVSYHFTVFLYLGPLSCPTVAKRSDLSIDERSTRTSRRDEIHEIASARSPRSKPTGTTEREEIFIRFENDGCVAGTDTAKRPCVFSLNSDILGLAWRHM